MSTQTVSEHIGEPAVRSISEARLAANRANAQKSTGPRTPEGKAAVSNNALKHGLRSERNPLDLAADAALPHEQTQFLETLAALKEDLSPIGATETLLLERLAHLDLRLQRALRMETAHLNLQASTTIRELTAAGSKIATETGAYRDNGLTMMAFLRDPNALTLIGRYESRLGRDIARTLTQFHQAQKLRFQGIQKLRKQTQPSDESTISIQSLASNGQLAEHIPTKQTQPPTGTIPTQSRVREGAGVNDIASDLQILAEQTQPAAPSADIQTPSVARTPTPYAAIRKGQPSTTTL